MRSSVQFQTNVGTARSSPRRVSSPSHSLSAHPAVLPKRAKHATMPGSITAPRLHYNLAQQSIQNPDQLMTERQKAAKADVKLFKRPQKLGTRPEWEGSVQCPNNKFPDRPMMATIPVLQSMRPVFNYRAEVCRPGRSTSGQGLRALGPPRNLGRGGRKGGLQGPQASFLTRSATDRLQGPIGRLSARVKQNRGEGEGEDHHLPPPPCTPLWGSLAHGHWKPTPPPIPNPPGALPGPKGTWAEPRTQNRTAVGCTGGVRRQHCNPHTVRARDTAQTTRT